MVKKMRTTTSIILIICLLIYCIPVYAVDQSEYKAVLTANNPSNLYEGNVEVVGAKGQIDFWHTSERIWHVAVGGAETKVYVSQNAQKIGGTYIPADIASDAGVEDIEISNKLPDSVIKHIKRGGNIEVALTNFAGIAKFQNIVNTSRIAPRYRIQGDYIYFKFSPKFNCAQDGLSSYVPGIYDIAPTVESGYGYNLFSIKNKNGAHIGEAHGNNIWENESGVISVNSSTSDIVDSNGIIKGGKKNSSYSGGRWNPSTGTICLRRNKNRQ
jgi:hypothetical protein